MAKRKEGHKGIFFEAPEELIEEFKEVARANNRSVTGQLVTEMEDAVKEYKRVKDVAPKSKEKRQ